MPRPGVTGLLVLAVLGAGGPVAAQEDDDRDQWQIESDSRFVAYEVRSPATRVVHRRRRLVQDVGFAYARALGDEPSGPRLVARLRLRLDQEMGDTCLPDRTMCLQAQRPDDLLDYQPLVDDGTLDVPLAYLEAAGLPGGLRVAGGRVLITDPIGFSRLDGMAARVEPASWVAFDAYGGVLVRDTTFLGSDSYVPLGSLRRDLPDALERERVEFVGRPSTTWTTGAAMEAGIARIARGRVGFRERHDGDGVTDRRLSLSLASQPIEALRAELLAVLDMLDGGLLDGVAALTVLAGERVTLRASAERHVPRFDAGTIWAWFDLVPVSELRLGATVKAGPRASFGLGVRGRHASPGDGDVELDGTVEGWLRARLRATDIDLSAGASGGDLGPGALIVLALDRPVGRRLLLHARASLVHFDDPLRQGMWGWSFAEAVRASVLLTRRTTVSLEGEHAASRVVGHRFRLLAALDFEVWR